MTTRRDMTSAQFRRALDNQEFKTDLGGFWYCSTRKGTDKTISYGAFVVGWEGRLHRRETVRSICEARTRHEKKRKNEKDRICVICNGKGRAQTFQRMGDTNQIAGFQKCVVCKGRGYLPNSTKGSVTP